MGGLLRVPFLSHEEQWRGGCEQENRRRCAQRVLILYDVADALAEGAIADLIVVLQKDDKRRGGSVSCRSPRLRFSCFEYSPWYTILPPGCGTVWSAAPRHSPRNSRLFPRSRGV